LYHEDYRRRATRGVARMDSPIVGAAMIGHHEC
jgi:hypothetical protein